MNMMAFNPTGEQVEKWRREYFALAEKLMSMTGKEIIANLERGENDLAKASRLMCLATALDAAENRADMIPTIVGRGLGLLH